MNKMIFLAMAIAIAAVVGVTGFSRCCMGKSSIRGLFKGYCDSRHGGF